MSSTAANPPQSARSTRRRQALALLDDGSPGSSSSSSAPQSSKKRPLNTAATADDLEFDFSSSSASTSSNPSHASTSAAPPSSTKKSKKGRRESRSGALPTVGGGGLPSSLSGSNASHVQAYLLDLKDEVDRRCNVIRQAVEDGVLALHACLQTELVKLPKSVRRQPYSDYAVTKPSATPHKSVGAVSSSSSFSSSSSSATPSTVVRAPRKGEALLSANGSPLLAVDPAGGTVRKRRGVADAPVAGAVPSSSSSSSSFSSSASLRVVAVEHALAVELDSGIVGKTLAELSKPGVVAGLNDVAKTSAKAKLQALQDEIAALMAQIN